MSGSNERKITSAINRFLKEKYDEMEQRMCKFCDEIIDSAITFRLENSKAHNFTGNLINSIIAALYREGKFVMAVTPGMNQGIDPPIRRKMTYPHHYYFGLNAKGELQKLGYDYDTARSSYYEPELVTGPSYGNTDAKNFAAKFKSNRKNVFHIVVAYTTEYASFVEAKRHTTGYIGTVSFIEANAANVLNV